MLGQFFATFSSQARTVYLMKIVKPRYMMSTNDVIGMNLYTMLLDLIDARVHKLTRLETIAIIRVNSAGMFNASAA
jgi:hypothetical protein